MWQLVMTEAIYLPTVMREYLHRETEMLQLFAEVIPILAPCLIPPPPFPTMGQTLLASQNIGGTSVGEPLLPSLSDDPSTVKVTGSVTRAAIPMTPSSGGTQPSTPLSSQQSWFETVVMCYSSCRWCMGRSKQGSGSCCSFPGCPEIQRSNDPHSLADEYRPVIQQC